MAKIKKKTFVKNEQTFQSLELKKKSKFRLGKRGIFLLVIIIIILGSFATYFYIQYQGTSIFTNDPAELTKQQTKSLLDKVGGIILLPTNEQPQIATVTDISKLADQPFFAKAENGDKVLIYQASAKVILYRPSINKIVDVAPLNTTNPQNPAGPTPTGAQISQTATATVVNGTLTSGLARTAKTKIEGSLSNITVDGVGDAVNHDYQQTVVFDVSGNKELAATQVANLLGAKVVKTLPEGESKHNSDILVILGSDFVGK